MKAYSMFSRTNAGTVSIASEGATLALFRHARAKLEAMLHVCRGALTALSKRPDALATEAEAIRDRRALRDVAFKGDVRPGWRRDRAKKTAGEFNATFSEAGDPDPRVQGHISLVGAGPGARDLLTLRAVERLQEADVIFYDRLVEPAVLEFARPEAERVFVGKQVGANAWPQEKICALIVAEARQGRRVVRLKSGDPGVFCRATEELTAAQSAGVPIDIVPGVTAAAAAGAALGQSLTERGATDTFILATGTGCADNPEPECTRLAGPGTTTAFYMSTRQAGRIAGCLAAQGFPASGEIDICVDVSKPTERLIKSTLATLPYVMTDNDVSGGAVILVRWPRNQVCQSSVVATGVAKDTVTRLFA